MASRSKSKVSKLGHDPLAWMDEEDLPAKEGSPDQMKDTEIEAPVAATQAESISADEIEQSIETEVDEAQAEQTQQVPEPVEASSGRIDLPSYFGIAQVADCKLQMAQVLKSEDHELLVNVDELESIDTAAIQLLIGFKAAAEEADKSIRYVGQSEKLTNIVDLLNLRQVLAIPE